MLNVQRPQKEHAADSNLLRSCYLEIPDHGQWQYDDVDIQYQEENVLNDPHDMYIDAMPSHDGFVPGILDRRALEDRGKDLRHADSNRQTSAY